jgi:hypothetical protein
MDVLELKKKHSSLIAEAKALTAKENPTADDLAKVTELLGKADEAKAMADTMSRIADGESFGNASAGTTAAHLGFRQAGADEGLPEIDEKSWRSVEILVPGHYGPEKKSVRYHVPLAVTHKGYEHAYEAYLRKGRREMGSNDHKALTEGVDTAGGLA